MKRQANAAMPVLPIRTIRLCPCAGPASVRRPTAGCPDFARTVSRTYRNHGTGAVENPQMQTTVAEGEQPAPRPLVNHSERRNSPGAAKSKLFQKAGNIADIQRATERPVQIENCWPAVNATRRSGPWRQPMRHDTRRVLIPHAGQASLPANPTRGLQCQHRKHGHFVMSQLSGRKGFQPGSVRATSHWIV